MSIGARSSENRDERIRDVYFVEADKHPGLEFRTGRLVQSPHRLILEDM